MKKLMALALALVLVLALVACSSKKDSSDSGKSNNSTTESGSNNQTDSGKKDSQTDSKTDSNTDSNSSTPASAATALSGTKIFLDLEEVETKVAPHIVNYATMVPVQAILEKYGYDVKWVAAENKLEVWEPSRQHPTIVLEVGSTTAYYEIFAEELGERISVEGLLEAAPILIDGTLLAPVSFVAESTGFVLDTTVDSTDIYLFTPGYMENQEGEGIGEDKHIDEELIGEGIGFSMHLSEDERSYVLSIHTEEWLNLTDAQKFEVVFLIGRWWDTVDGYVVEDYDGMVEVLDHQMETYFRNKVNEGIMQTACDIYGLEFIKYSN